MVVKIIPDADCGTAQQCAIRFVRLHYHACHGLDDGRIRVGIGAREVIGVDRFPIDTTELSVIKPTRKEVKNLLGY